MTAEDIIAANPKFGFVKIKIGTLDGLKGHDPDTGRELWVIWYGEQSYVEPGPWSKAQIFRATEFLLANAGRIRYPETVMIH